MHTHHPGVTGRNAFIHEIASAITRDEDEKFNFTIRTGQVIVHQGAEKAEKNTYKEKIQHNFSIPSRKIFYRERRSYSCLLPYVKPRTPDSKAFR